MEILILDVLSGLFPLWGFLVNMGGSSSPGSCLHCRVDVISFYGFVIVVR